MKASFMLGRRFSPTDLHLNFGARLMCDTDIAGGAHFWSLAIPSAEGERTMV